MNKLLKIFHIISSSDCPVRQTKGWCSRLVGVELALIVTAGVLLGSLASNLIVMQPSLIIIQEVNASKKYNQRLDTLEQDVEQIRSEIKTLKEHHIP